jgi:type I restriction enzyme R subunit
MPASSSSRPIWLRRWCCCRKICSSSTAKDIGQPRRPHHNKGLFNWRDEQAGDFETLVKTFLTPRRVVRVVSEFILFTRKDEEFSKVGLRPHQMRAVERCVSRCRDKEKRRGLVWHTQGSGKTHTMITVAKRLIEDAIFDNPTVLMLVDRNELESQLFQNLQQVALIIYR